MQIIIKRKMIFIILFVCMQILMIVYSGKASGDLFDNIKAIDPYVTWLENCGYWNTGQKDIWGFYRVITGYIGGHDELYLQWGKISIHDGKYTIVNTVSVDEINYHYANWTIDKVSCEESKGKTLVILSATNDNETDLGNPGKYKIIIKLGEKPGSYLLEKSIKK